MLSFNLTVITILLNNLTDPENDSKVNFNGN